MTKLQSSMEKSILTRCILVTGGAGFIGSNFVLDWLAAGNCSGRQPRRAHLRRQPREPRSVASDRRYTFVHGDIGDAALVARLLAEHRPCAIVHFAAESHVDRSIARPGGLRPDQRRRHLHPPAGRPQLLQRASTGEERERFRFLHVSTDEVYGSLAPTTLPSTKRRPTRPTRPYAASKAASDHLVRAWLHTYGLPTLITNCSNNYGPYQFPEKLIPLMILNALEGKPLPVYGDGQQVRDWLYVDDHCQRAPLRARAAAASARPTTSAAGNQRTNLDVVTTSARCSTSSCPTRRTRPTSSSSTTSPTAPATTAATPSTPEARRRARLARPGELRDRPAQNRRLVPRQRRLGRGRHQRSYQQWIDAELRWQNTAKYPSKMAASVEGSR